MQDGNVQQSKKYEEHAYVLDVNLRGRSTAVRGRNGTIITAIGEDRLTLLEILGVPNSSFEIAERIYIGKEGRTKIQSVLGKTKYGRMSPSAKAELPGIVETVVANSEQKFVDYLNNAGPLTSRIHALELIPGIGKKYTKAMLDERDRRKFESYEDLQDRIGFNEPVKRISERIMEEIAGETRMNLFIKR